MADRDQPNKNGRHQPGDGNGDKAEPESHAQKQESQAQKQGPDESATHTPIVTRVGRRFGPFAPDPVRPREVHPRINQNLEPGSLPPFDADAHALTARNKIWMYLSGGGLSAAMASLGAMYFLQDLQRWQQVERISSVSGGMLTNAAIALHDGGVGVNADVTPFSRDAIERLSSHGGVQLYWRTALMVVASLVLLAATAVLLIVELVVDTFWPWWIGMPLWVLLVVMLVVAVLYTLRQYIRDRAAYIVGARRKVNGSRKRTLGDVVTPALQIFTTTNNVSGMPAYLATKGGDGLLVHDRSEQINRLEYLDATGVRYLDVLYGGVVWPAIGIPKRLKLAHTGQVDAAQVTTQPVAPVPANPPAPPPAGTTEKFALSDGGLNGTLTGRLDPPLYRVMEQGTTHALGVHLNVPPPGGAHEDVLRYVVDGGSQLSGSSYWSQAFPPVTIGSTTLRSIKISLAGLLGMERVLADGRDFVWYMATTGHDRVFRLAFTAQIAAAWSASDPLNAQGLGGALLNRQLEPGRTNWFEVPPGGQFLLPEWANVVQILINLKAESDQISYFRYKAFSTGSAASGLATAFVEAYGVGYHEVELRDLLREFELQMLRKGGLDRALGGRDSRLRWEELEKIGLPGLFSHRGIEPPNGKRNTIASFEAAYNEGYRNFEIDVHVAKGQNNPLVAVHPTLRLWVRKGWFQWKRIANTTPADLHAFAGIETLDQILQAFQNRNQEVTWNIETKHGPSMKALIANHLQAAPPAGSRPMVISAGWRYRLLRQVRKNNPEQLTAGSYREKWQLFRNKRAAPHVALIQVPRTFAGLSVKWFWKRIASNARQEGIAVYWWRVKTQAQIDEILDFRTPDDAAAQPGYDGIMVDDHVAVRQSVIARFGAMPVPA